MNNSETVKLEELLSANGYSVTRQRKYLLEAMLNQEPMSMHELTDKLKDKLDRVSVYRTVELFEKLGIIQRLNIGWKYKLELSDIFNVHHHHMTCLDCGNLIQINKYELEAFIDQVANENGFKPKNHQIEIQGYCSNCTK